LYFRSKGPNEITSDEAKGLLRVVTDYSYGLDLLDDYDHGRVAPTHVEHRPARTTSDEFRLDSLPIPC
jgi:hypothetical protein